MPLAFVFLFGIIMATIDSVEFLLKRTGDLTGGNITVEIRAAASSGTNPETGAILATKTIDTNTITLGAYAWVSFTFAAPATVAADGFYGVHLFTDLSQFAAGRIKWENATDNVDPSSPFDGDEQFFDKVSSSWGTTSLGIPYKVLGTDIDGNDAVVQSGTERSFITFDTYQGTGSRSYIVVSVVAPTLDSPADESTGIYLNKDHLLGLEWSDAEGVPIADHTVYFNGVARTDRSRYSIVVYKIFLDVTLDYSTTYQWFVRKDLGGGNSIDSETWSFTTMAFSPPAPSTRTRPPYGGGADITVLTGENNMITVQRLIAIGRNKFFYEDV